jgi:DNA polymerase III epsilon subunit-like protein
MSWIVVDVESDGPVPPKYSMVSFGAVVVEPSLAKTFYGRIKPISSDFIPDALAVSGHSRQEHESFDSPRDVMLRFKEWLEQNSSGRPIFVSDNVAFDWQWINYYFHTFTDENPFGHSGRRIGDLYAGLVKDTFAQWRHLKKTPHTHHPVDDAKGNAEAVLAMKEMGLKIPSK